MVRSGKILGDSASIESGKQAAARLWALAYDPKSGELKHEIFRGQAQTPGYLDDYALLGLAFLSLHAATADTAWRDKAAALAAAMLERFSKAGTLSTTVATNDLLIPLADDGDSTTPSGTSAALELLARLYEITGKKEYAQSALQILSGVSGSIGQSPGVWSSAVAAVNRHALPVGTTAERQAETSERDRATRTAQHDERGSSSR